jgi:uncharacterized tellurite resistance protein B-like protein
MSILETLGLKPRSTNHTSEDAAAVRRIAAELDALPAERARWIAAFAYILSRIAQADLDVSDVESQEMVRQVSETGGLPEPQALLVVEIAKRQSALFGGTENFLVTRQFRDEASRKERRRMLDCALAVAAADDSISGVEEHEARRIASELGLEHADFIAALKAYSGQREVLKGLTQPADDDGDTDADETAEE